MEFMEMPPEQENRLAEIMREVTATDPSPALQQAERSEPNTVNFRITQEAAPDILDKIIKRVNEKGVLTKHEILDILKPSI